MNQFIKFMWSCGQKWIDMWEDRFHCEKELVLLCEKVKLSLSKIIF